MRGLLSTAGDRSKRSRYSARAAVWNSPESDPVVKHNTRCRISAFSNLTHPGTSCRESASRPAVRAACGVCNSWNPGAALSVTQTECRRQGRSQDLSQGGKPLSVIIGKIKHGHVINTQGRSQRRARETRLLPLVKCCLPGWHGVIYKTFPK